MDKAAEKRAAEKRAADAAAYDTEYEQALALMNLDDLVTPPRPKPHKRMPPKETVPMEDWM